VSDMPDMNNLLAQAMAMQQKLVEAQEAAASRTVEGVSGGGVVRVEVSGAMEFKRLHIDPKVVDPSDVSMLEDLLLAAVHDAASQVAELNQESMSGMGLDGIMGQLS
jgi:nucleoid-associated protein EbfC